MENERAVGFPSTYQEIPGLDTYTIITYTRGGEKFDE